jgi:lipopolysaccharide export system protein LptC
MLGDRSVWIFILVAILAIASWGVLQWSVPEQGTEQVFAKHSADYYSSGYEKREMNEQGLLSSEIKAFKMVHYSDDGTVHLEKPSLSFFNGQLPPWVIQAERGVLSGDGKELWLQGSVLVRRAAPKGGRAITIKTSEVRVQPETSDAETAQWAELSSPPDVTEGVGMQLHFADPIHIKLLSKVRGKYENH